MSRVLVDQLLALAERLRSGSIAGRADSTRRFWLIARQLRAGLPPLMLPARTGTSQRRIGYCVTSATGWMERLGQIQGEHSERDERVCLYLRGNFAMLPPIDWAKRIDLNSLNDIQAARVIAEDDLDLLVDPDGEMLQAMPLLIALHPARQIVEAVFVPATTGEPAVITGDPMPPIDAQGAMRLARAAIEALPELSNGASESPATLNARLNRGIQMHQAGELAAARDVYMDVLAHHPQHPIAAYLLGQLLHQQRLTGEAISALQVAATAAPEFRDAHYTLAQRLVDAGHWHEAVAAYRHALDLTPGFAAGWSGLGLATLRIGDSASRSAIGHLERATALEPESAQWMYNLGTGWQRIGNRAAAREAYVCALRLDPDHDEARFNLGAFAQEAGDHALAIDAYRKVLDRKPGFAAAYAQLGACLLLGGQIEAWIDNFVRYRDNCPESLSMAVYGLEASVAMGDAAAHASWRDRIVAGAFPAPDAEDFTRNWEQLLFLLLHVDVERGTLLEWYCRYDEMATAWYGAATKSRPARKPGPLRVGYLSGDLRDHVMGRMIFELVSRHDRSRFEPRLYSLSATADAWTQRFRDLGVPFVDIASLPHANAAARIEGDDIDILVDCCGHTRGAQQGILALRPARIVATHIATPGPVGLQSIDYKLTDTLAESHDAQQFAIEQLWPVTGGVFPWHRYGEPTDSTRASLGIGADAFVCGAFVSLMKLSPRCLRLWRQALEHIPNAVLAFSPPGENWHPAYMRWLRTHSIDADRVVFIPHRQEEAGALARYRVLDVVLDPMPCGNVNGTMEALAMGVPVVTLVGCRHGERLGNALLTRFGVTDTIASTENEYVDAVARLARDREWSAQLRAKIHAANRESLVWDGDARIRDLESAFAEMIALREPIAAR